MLFFVALAVAIAFAAVAIYNLLVKRTQMAEAGWSDIDVQLKRRADLIPPLVETVKGYAGHEKVLFEDIAERRASALSAGDDPEMRAEAEKALAKPVSKLFALAEDYPELKASENFLDLQRQLAETEDKIEMARRFYNGAVRELNTLIASFPVNIFAGPVGFSKKIYFEIEASDRAAPRVAIGN
ncbi:MAG: LemA family protein [Pseudomonadota bacterium]